MSLDYKWKIFFKPIAQDQLRKLPEDIQKRIVSKMRFFALSVDIFKFASKLKDRKYGEYKFRVGDYRVVFDIIHSRKELLIVKIGRRDEVYK